MIQDKNGKNIEIGNFARYINTGTEGVVKEFKNLDNEKLVVLDNNLAYKPHLIEIIEKINTKNNNKKIEVKDDDINLSNSDEIDSCGAG
ncbi:DUF2098 family protein [Methanococcus voltae]|uniref:Uncharacterized protein n=1 Tax=Methanococcus voltae (strain ATCC BAA-1334 / A3) TaxID=456320 RepID=D7DVA2_METV3|nr:DUF2098 family protein [Methanococcus voltae]MCS3901895.1 hypothetical protein [Methanococcus voltae]